MPRAGPGSAAPQGSSSGRPGLAPTSASLGWAGNARAEPNAGLELPRHKHCLSSATSGTGRHTELQSRDRAPHLHRGHGLQDPALNPRLNCSTHNTHTHPHPPSQHTTASHTQVLPAHRVCSQQLPWASSHSPFKASPAQPGRPSPGAAGFEERPFFAKPCGVLSEGSV